MPQLERTVGGATLQQLRCFSERAAGFRCSSMSARSVLMSLLFTGGLLAQAYAEDEEGWLLALVGLLSLLCTSQLAVALVNWLATVLVTPHALPRMDFSKGIPPESRTLVVVPTMLSSVEHIEQLIEALEVRFLANRDEPFALLPVDRFPGRARGNDFRKTSPCCGWPRSGSRN